MTLQFSNHTVHHLVGDEQKVQLPGQVFEVDDKHVAFLQKAGATRDPTDAEDALHRMSNPVTKAPKAAAAPAPAPAKTEVEPAAEAEAGGGTDEDDVG